MINSSQVSIQTVNADRIIKLRARILRPHQEPIKCQYEEDLDPSTLHVAAIFENRVLSCGTFIKQKSNLFPHELGQYRLRGMATDTEFQRRGLGQSIIQFAQTDLLNRNVQLLWFNARTSAEGFYQKMGYEKTGDIFEIEGVGPHVVMWKILTP